MPQSPNWAPTDPSLTPIISAPSGIPKWRIPLISQRAYFSGGDGSSAPFLTGTLPLDMQRPFDPEPMIRQSEEFMLLRSLLEERLDDLKSTSGESTGFSHWTNQPIRTDVNGGVENLSIKPRISEPGLTFFSMTIETLGAADSQRELVQKTVTELKNYIAVAQPNSQDMIVQNQADQPPLTIRYNSGEGQLPAFQDSLPTADNAIQPLVPLETSQKDSSEYTRMFSFNNIWEFMTSGMMIALYILWVALWAAWRYAIRRFV